MGGKNPKPSERENCDDKNREFIFAVRQIDSKKATIEYHVKDSRSVECIITAIRELSDSMDSSSKQFFQAAIEAGLEATMKKLSGK